MENGDIDNRVSPRLVIVWENLLGLLPNKRAEVKCSTYIRYHRWKRAVNTFEINGLLADRIWDVTWRLNFSVDLITYLPEPFAVELEKRISREDLPIGHVTAESPAHLAKRIAYMQHIACIYDPNPANVYTYGSRGRYLHAADANMIGAF